MMIYSRFYTRYEEEVIDQLSGSTVSLKITFQSGRVVNLPLRTTTTLSKDSVTPKESDDPSTITTDKITPTEVRYIADTHPSTSDPTKTAAITDDEQPTSDPPKTTTIRMSRGNTHLKLIIPSAIGSTVVVLVAVILCIRGK